MAEKDEELEELENTKKITKIEDIETKKVEKEDTKEIKNLDELNEKENAEIEEEKEEKKEKDTEKSPKKEDSKKPNKNKIIIIAGIVVIVLLLIIIISLLLLSGNKNNKSKDSSKEKNIDNSSMYVKAINKSVKDGSLKEEINKALTENSLETSEFNLISLDIDSDKEQELIAYVEGWKEKFLLHFEVDEEVNYEESYKIDSQSSLGYTYSIKDEKNYWYIENEGQYTILGDTKLVIKEEDFLKDYFSITKEYKQKPFLSNTISYRLDNNLDAKELEKNQITAADILKDNNTTDKEIKEEAEKYVKNLQEAEQKKKEEEEIKKKEEEIRKINSYSFNGNIIHFGEYIPRTSGTITKLTINKDGTGTINDEACTWEENAKKIIETEDETKVLTFTCGEKTYDLTSYNNDTLTDSNKIELTYKE